jgi:2-dehydro-3-deoxygluconokinase
MRPALLDPVPVSEARAVLVTGVTALIGADAQAAGLALLDRARGLRVVDPNLRAGLWGSGRRAALVRPFVEHCDLLLCGAGEIAEVLGTTDEGNSEALARLAAAAGPSEVVVRSAATIGALAGGVWCEMEIRRDAAVDPIGAGDAFNAGYIAVRLRGGTVESALRAGASCGAAVTTAVSDTSAFPRTLT